MRFAGQIRMPEVDHPGVPATFLVDENQAEVILEGESLGRWSLFDVQVDRLVSKAFQVDLDGEEITFLADEPVDFAYKGVEHMAEVWARYKTMTIARRLVAVRRSRKGTTPSRLAELREAMLENLAEEQSSYRRSLAGETFSVAPGAQVVDPVAELEPEAEPEASPFVDSPIEDRSENRIPKVPLVGETTGDRADQLEVARTAAALEAEHQKATDALEAERQNLEAERVQVDGERKRLDEALAEAERLEGERLQAARMDLERLEAERKSLEQRHETERLETARLEAERKELKTLDAERVKRERAENERFEAQRKELERLEADRIEREQTEAGRIEKERHELERVEVARVEATRLEMERLEAERKELERLEVERLEAEKKELKRLEAEKTELEAALALEAAAAEAAALEAAEAAKAKAAEEAAAFEAETQANADKDRIAKEDAKATDPVKEVIATSSDGEDPETAKELVVDLGEMEQDQPEAPAPSRKPTGEPAMAATAAKSGLMGAVKSAFSRNGGRNHVHDFTEAPGGIGMVRYICRDCGFVSISSSD